MDRVWLSDFRSQQFKYYLDKASTLPVYDTINKARKTKNIFMTDDFGDFYWLSSLESEFTSIFLPNCAVILLLGLNDCINCCLSRQSIRKVAEQYSKFVNDLANRFVETRFYFCTINPVDCKNFMISTPIGNVLKDELNTAIKIFNETLLKECPLAINNYYGIDSSYETLDGLRYTQNTCNNLLSYILCATEDSLSCLFESRTQLNFEFKDSSNIEIDSAGEYLGGDGDDLAADAQNYWISSDQGGLSPFPTKNSDTGLVLPSNRAYAWGRFYEILGERPESLEDTENWWYAAHNYPTGVLPQLGAIACWKADDQYYFAIVEKINLDGSIETSESSENWETFKIWDLVKHDRNSDGVWECSSATTFLGFIYNPMVNNQIILNNSKDIILDNFKVDKLLSSSVEISFLAKNINKIIYRVLNDNNQELIKREVQIFSSEYLQILGFLLKDLKPETTYTIYLRGFSDSVELNNPLEYSITFSTPRDYPDSAKAISLTVPADAYKSNKTLFTLNITKPDYLGYWKNNSGYDIQLIVNNRCVKTITNGVADINWKNFSIKEKFDYTCKTGDIIQIGVRVWVKDNNGKKVYNLSGVKTSKPICLLNKHVITYLNIN